IEQVLLNLAVNASDAMPDGGHLTFRTSMADLDDTDPDAAAGIHRHVCLVVKDTGIGMDRATSARIFEPFFTTKGSNGTGLGLSIVKTLVSQLNGEIIVKSRVGEGSTFTVKLPQKNG
ncbi:MAG: hypothetical protein HC880_14005, partial [Bacteroidia bacterium]|nr:hypothetical protein [Bacteroidia bacterium]